MSKRGPIGAAVAAITAIVVAITVTFWDRPANGVVPPRRHLSQADAVRRAKDFTKAIGVMLAGPPVALFPAPNEFPDQQDIYWGKRWNLKYHDGTEIQVADGSGIVTSYDRISTIDPMLQTQKAALPESKALSIAERVRRASGQRTELGKPRARLDDTGSPGKEWSVTWPRIAGRTEYSDQNAEVTMVGSSGAIIYYVIRFPSPAADAAAPRITQARAERTARGCLKDHGQPRAKLEKKELLVVQANRKWEIGDAGSLAGETPIGGPARKAWVFTFADGDRRWGRWYSVFIDAKTGAVIGGHLWQLD